MTALQDPDIVTAQALLATCRRVMTGREIAICEDLIENAPNWGERDWEYFDVCDRSDFTSLSIR